MTQTALRCAVTASGAPRLFPFQVLHYWRGESVRNCEGGDPQNLNTISSEISGRRIDREAAETIAIGYLGSTINRVKKVKCFSTYAATRIVYKLLETKARYSAIPSLHPSRVSQVIGDGLSRQRLARA